jgi:hypothetical protein
MRMESGNFPGISKKRRIKKMRDNFRYINTEFER